MSAFIVRIHTYAHDFRWLTLATTSADCPSPSRLPVIVCYVRLPPAVDLIVDCCRGDAIAVDRLRRLPPTILATSGNRLPILPSTIILRHDFRRPSWPPLTTPRVYSALVGVNHSSTGRNESSSYVISTVTSPHFRLVIIVSTTSDW